MVVFLTILIGGTALSIFLGWWVMRQPCKPIGPGDPCDGPPMLGMSIIYVFSFGSLILAVAGSISAYIYLRWLATWKDPD